MSSEGDAAIALARMTRAVLSGYSLGVQGAVLAQLLAKWLADHPVIAREPLLDDHLQSVRRMVAQLEKDGAMSPDGQAAFDKFKGR